MCFSIWWIFSALVNDSPYQQYDGEPPVAPNIDLTRPTYNPPGSLNFKCNRDKLGLASSSFPSAESSSSAAASAAAAAAAVEAGASTRSITTTTTTTTTTLTTLRAMRDRALASDSTLALPLPLPLGPVSATAVSNEVDCFMNDLRQGSRRPSHCPSPTRRVKERSRRMTMMAAVAGKGSGNRNGEVDEGIELKDVSASAKSSKMSSAETLAVLQPSKFRKRVEAVRDFEWLLPAVRFSEEGKKTEEGVGAKEDEPEKKGKGKLEREEDEFGVASENAVPAGHVAV
ncbi:MAG: hypothetical protein M1833_007282 [Piccolia ochrophora]|nr:MAG: hypothetical protein M1833_007282 [Piccolia ochrophora]